MRPSKHHRPFRHATERLLDVLLLKGWVAGLSWRLGGHGRLGVTRHEVDLGPERRLPRPLRIAFASDFHAGPTTAPAIFDVLLEQVRRERPDVLLLGGDYISFDAANIRALRTFLVQARTPLGTYAVLGNHDVWNGSEEVSAALAAAGVEVLVNRNVALPEPFGDVSICGIDDPWTGTPALDAAFAGAGPIRIYLMHSPDGMALLDGQRFDLALAGHTHGGQIVSRDGTPLKRPGGRGSRLYPQGRFEIAGNGPLFVGRGIGCAGIPLRLHADPELLICTLR
ncbi:metallophosphoesterase [Massilia norwichensis]|uniref:Metallophosphoesterase n=1 Tax=Massilia norwichensis TaxID=1442366 RepID=A0ABT2A611_9BURK|nr:metallophosphoesterase [Massilia norwichensis]MCS0589623.1 metallophosphoesterase [Massilia norwichensis]